MMHQFHRLGIWFIVVRTFLLEWINDVRFTALLLL
jgi:hypothetical protein